MLREYKPVIIKYIYMLREPRPKGDITFPTGIRERYRATGPLALPCIDTALNVTGGLEAGVLAQISSPQAGRCYPKIPRLFGS
jgi:hypothetical protein